MCGNLRFCAISCYITFRCRQDSQEKVFFQGCSCVCHRWGDVSCMQLDWFLPCNTLYAFTIQGDSTSVTFADLIADHVQSAVDFFDDFVSELVLFQMELNQNSFVARKMFPFWYSFVVECTWSMVKTSLVIVGCTHTFCHRRSAMIFVSLFSLIIWSICNKKLYWI